jgi:hypothetical protein
MANLTQKLLKNPTLTADYLAKKVSAKEIADKYGYSESYVLSTLSRMGVKRPYDPDSTYRQQKSAALLAEIRREFRAYLAEKVVNEGFSIEKAAELANCSERTMFRYVSEAKNKRN